MIRGRPAGADYCPLHSHLLRMIGSIQCVRERRDFMQTAALDRIAQIQRGHSVDGVMREQLRPALLVDGNSVVTTARKFSTRRVEGKMPAPVTKAPRDQSVLYNRIPP